jgi:sorting nexin-29
MYRGISISSIYSRVIDRMLHHRLDPAMEGLGVRAVTQCGFRREHGTIDVLFTLTHLINQARHQRKKLYVVFIDFKKAFDTVPRDLLLERCKQLGVHGRFLSLLERLYDTILMQVVVNGKLVEPIDTCLGTKQGSELSPLLFGLFIEMLHELITIRGKPSPGGGVTPLGPRV